MTSVPLEDKVVECISSSSVFRAMDVVSSFTSRLDKVESVRRVSQVASDCVLYDYLSFIGEFVEIGFQRQVIMKWLDIGWQHFTSTFDRHGAL